MNHRTILLLLALATLPLPAFGANPKPNILYILTDDQGWSSLSCYGGRYVETPNLDTLAREGTRFTQAYVTPQCSPTRAALLTGQHTARNRMWHVLPWYGTPWAPVMEPAFVEHLPRETFTFPKGLQKAGYVTGMAGKWHLTTNADSDNLALKPEAAAHYGFDVSALPGPGSRDEGDKHVDYLTDQAIHFMQANRDRPWFFYLAHHTVHGRVSAPAELVRKHLAAGAPEIGLHNATYRAALEHLDNSVGRLMRAVDELGLRQRTLVVFLSDNGGVYQAYDVKPFTASPGTATALQVGKEEYSNAPLRAGKGGPYEGGIRVPCLVRWPQMVPAGTVSDTPVHVVDWAATLLDAAGTRPPASHSLDGTSLMPLFQNGTLPTRPLYWYMPLYDLRWGATPCAVIRDGDWKLIDYFGDHVDAQGRYTIGPRVELFNLGSDPAETTDLSSLEADRAQFLQAKLRRWMRELSAPLPGPNPYVDPSQLLKETKIKPAHVEASPSAPSGKAGSAPVTASR